MRTFGCPSCHAKFAWKDAYLNRKVSCKCGCVFEAFEDPEEAAPQVDPYDVADDGEGPAVPPASTVAQPAMPAAAGITPYPTRPTRITADTAGARDVSTFRGVVLPIALLAVGVALLIVQGLTLSSQEVSAGRAIALNGVFLGLMVLTMLAGAAIAGSLLGVDFGSLGLATLKFTAAAVFAGAIALAVAGMDKSDSLTGPVVAWHLVFIIYWVCFHLFFDLDLQENLMSVAVIAFMQAAVACILWTI